MLPFVAFFSFANCNGSLVKYWHATKHMHIQVNQLLRHFLSGFFLPCKSTNGLHECENIIYKGICSNSLFAAMFFYDGADELDSHWMLSSNLGLEDSRDGVVSFRHSRGTKMSRETYVPNKHFTTRQ